MTRNRKREETRGNQMVELILENEQDKEELTPEIEKRRNKRKSNG